MIISLILKPDVAVEKLYNKLIHQFLDQLESLSIGYTFDSEQLCEMMTLIQAIDFIEYGEPTVEELSKLIQYYG